MWCPVAITDQTIISCRPRRSFAMLYPNASVEALDVMNKLLQFNPQKRISAQNALEHPYVSSFRNPEEEIVLDSDVIPKLDDNTKCNVDKYRTRLYEVSTKPDTT